MKIALMLILSLSNLYSQQVDYLKCQLELEASLSVQYAELKEHLKENKSAANLAAQAYQNESVTTQALSMMVYETFKTEESDLYHPWRMSTSYGRKEAYQARVSALSIVLQRFYTTLKMVREELDILSRSRSSWRLGPSMTRDIHKLQADIAPFRATTEILPDCEFGQKD